MTFLENIKERYESAKSSYKNLYDRFIKDNEYVVAGIGLGATITGISIIKKLFFPGAKVGGLQVGAIPFPPGSNASTDEARLGDHVGGGINPSVGRADDHDDESERGSNNSGMFGALMSTIPNSDKMSTTVEGGPLSLHTAPGSSSLERFLHGDGAATFGHEEPLQEGELMGSQHLDYIRDSLKHSESAFNTNEEDAGKQHAVQEVDVSEEDIDAGIKTITEVPASPQTTPVPVAVEPSSPVIEEVDGQGAQPEEAGQYEQVSRYYSEDDDDRADSVAEEGTQKQEATSEGPASPQTTPVPVAVAPSGPDAPASVVVPTTVPQPVTTLQNSVQSDNPGASVDEAAPSASPQSPNTSATSWLPSWSTLATIGTIGLGIALAVAKANREDRQENAQEGDGAPASRAVAPTQPANTTTQSTRVSQEELHQRFAQRKALKKHREETDSQEHKPGTGMNYVKNTQEREDGEFAVKLGGANDSSDGE